jgi:hypothetical protein
VLHGGRGAAALFLLLDHCPHHLEVVGMLRCRSDQEFVRFEASLRMTKRTSRRP